MEQRADFRAPKFLGPKLSQMIDWQLNRHKEVVAHALLFLECGVYSRRFNECKRQCPIDVCPKAVRGRTALLKGSV